MEVEGEPPASFSDTRPTPKGCAPTHLASLASGEVQGKRTREETPATTGDRRLYGNLIARVQTERRPVVSLLWG